MVKKLLAAALLTTTLCSAAHIKVEDGTKTRILNSAYITQATYDAKKQRLAFTFLPNNQGTNFELFTVATKEEAEEIVRKLFDTQDNSIIPLKKE